MSIFSRRAVLAMLAGAGLVLSVATSYAQGSVISKRFSGAKVNSGTVTMAKHNGHTTLKLSPDFTVPDTPDPHWQIVDSEGTVYLLQRLPIKDNKVNREITLPRYIKDIAKVQIYCAWAEVVLGETTFDRTLTLN